MKGTDPVSYAYEIDGQKVIITRRHVRTAFPRNGNVGNPTEYFVWDVVVGEWRMTGLSRRADAYENARCHIAGVRYVNRPGRSENVRHFRLVEDEMKANYRGQISLW